MINPKLGRSQLLGGMTSGISVALHGHSVLDPRFGHIINHDLAGYHIATFADVGAVEVNWLDIEDQNSNPIEPVIAAVQDVVEQHIEPVWLNRQGPTVTPGIYDHAPVTARWPCRTGRSA